MFLITTPSVYNPYSTTAYLRQDSGITHTIGVELSGFWRNVVFQIVKSKQTSSQDAHIMLSELSCVVQS